MKKVEKSGHFVRLQASKQKSELILAGECLGREKDFGGLLLLASSANSKLLLTTVRLFVLLFFYAFSMKASSQQSENNLWNSSDFQLVNCNWTGRIYNAFHFVRIVFIWILFRSLSASRSFSELLWVWVGWIISFSSCIADIQQTIVVVVHGI